MTTYGYTLSSEEHSPSELVDLARRAEAVGFDFLTVSDHFHPWVQAQGHSPFVWSVLGAVAAVTDRVQVGVGVTCPIMRIHPAIVAHAAATASLLLEGRFFLGVGTGEALNEHIVGRHWPVPEIRRQMLAEAIDVMRQLWTGETVDHHGEHFTVENARLFDPPEAPLPVVVSAFGSDAASELAPVADGYWGTSPDADLLSTFAAEGGSGPRIGQVTVCWATDADAARATVHERWPNSGLPGQLAQDLPTWTHFEQATSVLSIEQTTEHVPCGKAVEPVLEQVSTYVDAGYDHLHFHQIGDDQRGFLDFWVDELGPALSSEGL